MKKFFGIISTFFALIQSFFFWFCFVRYITHLNQFGHILSHVGFWIITYIILFIFSIIDKFVRGLKGFEVIFLDALLSPIRFFAQLITTIHVFQGKTEIKRGGYFDNRFKNTFYFTLCSIDVSEPSDRVTHSYESTNYYRQKHYQSDRLSSSSSSSSSTSSSSSSSYSPSPRPEEKKPEKVYGYFAVLREMEMIAYKHQRSVFSSSRAEARIEINARINGNTITFSFNVKTHYLEWIKSQVEADDFQRDIKNELESIQSSIQSDVKDWLTDHAVDRDYYLSFR